MKQVLIHGLGQTPASWEPVLHLVDAPEDCVSHPGALREP